LPELVDVGSDMLGTGELVVRRRWKRKELVWPGGFLVVVEALKGDVAKWSGNTNYSG
jgi:hypothetical protein